MWPPLPALAAALLGILLLLLLALARPAGHVARRRVPVTLLLGGSPPLRRLLLLYLLHHPAGLAPELLLPGDHALAVAQLAHLCGALLLRWRAGLLFSLLWLLRGAFPAALRRWRSDMARLPALAAAIAGARSALGAAGSDAGVLDFGRLLLDVLGLPLLLPFLLAALAH